MACSVVISTNLEYLLTRPGLFKLLTLVFGVLTIGFGFRAVDASYYNENATEKLENEEYFQFAVLGVFVVSLVYLGVLCFSDEITNSRRNRISDALYHTVAAKVLLVAGILMITSAIHIESLGESCRRKLLKSIVSADLECQLHDFKILAACFALFNGLLYEITAYFAYTTKDLT